MAGHCRDAYGTQPPRHEADWESIERDGSADWQIPLRWVTAALGTLFVISLGLGLALKWLLQ